MICGFLPVIKPAGPTSAQVVARIRRLTGIRRVGHSGTLDPGADGVLVAALDRATVLLPYLPTIKTYRAEAVLGVDTDTLDAQGKTLRRRPVPDVSRAELEALLRRFTGDILQVPPQVSALWHQGRRMYDWAREGCVVEKPARPVTVHALTLLEFAPPRITFEVTCSGGTYIRVLAADLGEALGCGAHLSRLTRTGCNHFPLDRAADLETLAAAATAGRWKELVVPAAPALAHLPAVTVPAREEAAVAHGQALPWDPAAPQPKEPVRVLDAAGELLAMARFRSNRLVMERVLLKPEEAACA